MRCSRCRSLLSAEPGHCLIAPAAFSRHPFSFPAHPPAPGNRVLLLCRRRFAARCKSFLTVSGKYDRIFFVAELAVVLPSATVAQLVEQLTRNEQVACSNQVSSSKERSLKSGFVPYFSGIFLFVFSVVRTSKAILAKDLMMQVRRTPPGTSRDRLFQRGAHPTRRRRAPWILLRFTRFCAILFDELNKSSRCFSSFCPLGGDGKGKREAGVNPARSRHCDKGAFRPGASGTGH